MADEYRIEIRTVHTPGTPECYRFLADWMVAQLTKLPDDTALVCQWLAHGWVFRAREMDYDDKAIDKQD